MSGLGTLRREHIRDFVEWIKTEKRLTVQRVAQPWLEAEVFTGKVWEAIYYAPSDNRHLQPMVGRGLRSLVREFNQEQKALASRKRARARALH